MIKKLLITPNELLRQPSNLVEDATSPYIKELVLFLKSEALRLSAVGLAAPQFGEMLQVFIVSYQGIEIVAINPEVTQKKKKRVSIEGCKSIPNEIYAVDRPKIIKLKCLGIDGNIHSIKGHDLMACILMHEYDHLHGILIDTIGKLVK